MKGYSAILGVASEIALNRVDLPALGSPNNPTSANTLSSSRRFLSSLGRPRVVRRGALLVLDLKCVLPKPPRPPYATNTHCPGFAKSPINSPVSWSNTIVPTGTSRYESAPLRPVLFCPLPGLPFSALNLRVYLKSTRVFRACVGRR